MEDIHGHESVWCRHAINQSNLISAEYTGRLHLTRPYCIDWNSTFTCIVTGVSILYSRGILICPQSTGQPHRPADWYGKVELVLLIFATPLTWFRLSTHPVEHRVILILYLVFTSNNFSQTFDLGVHKDISDHKRAILTLISRHSCHFQEI